MRDDLREHEYMALPRSLALVLAFQGAATVGSIATLVGSLMIGRRRR